MGLHVGVVSSEQYFCTFNCEIFNDVDVLATAVVAFAGVALGVFVGQYTTLRFHHGRVGEVLGCDELDMALLALSLSGDSGVDFRIDAREWRLIQGGVVGRGGHNKCKWEIS